MKQNETKLRLPGAVNWYFVITILSLMMTLTKCKCEHKAQIEVISKVTAIHGIAVFDVNTTPLQNVHNVKMTLIDPERMVLSSNGFPFDSVRLTDGIMSIGLSPNARYSTERPYRFTIRAEADGYMTNTRSIVITSNSSNYIPIFLARVDNAALPPSGLAAAAGNITDVSGGVITTSQVLMTAKTNVDSLIIGIPANTRLFNGDKPVTDNGPLSYRLLSGMAKDSNANRAFPGGFEVTDALDQTGQKIASATDPMFFTTGGWFSLEMNIGKTVVNRFSQPLSVMIPVGDSVVNPATQQVAKAGDRISVWSMSAGGTWRLEEDALIVSSADGHLRANIQISHITPFNLDFKGTRCPAATTMQVNYIAGVFPSNGNYYSEYIRVSDNAVLKQGTSDFVTSASSKQIINAPLAGSGRLYVHNGGDQTSDGLAISDPLACAGPTSVPLVSIGTTPTSSCTTIKLLKNGTSDLLCPNNVWIENTGGTNYFAHVGTLNGGEINIPAISGPVTIELYYGTATGSIMLRIAFSSIDAPNGMAQVTIGGGSPQPVSYITDNSGPCGRTITLSVPVSGITCM